jgi:hypothetical protein
MTSNALGGGYRAAQKGGAVLALACLGEAGMGPLPLPAVARGRIGRARQRIGQCMHASGRDGIAQNLEFEVARSAAA